MPDPTNAGPEKTVIKITTIFYQVSPVKSAPDFEIALNAAFRSGDRPHERERQVSDKTIRLEALEQQGSDSGRTFYDGEIVKIQKSNLPPIANEEGMDRLDLLEGGGLGHCIAFSYSSRTRTLAMQYDNRAVSAKSMLAYLKSFDPSYRYEAEPCLRQDAQEKYKRGTVKKLQIRLATPERVQDDAADDTFMSSLQNFGGMLGGTVLTLEIQAGRKKSLIKRKLDKIVSLGSEQDARGKGLKKLSVVIDDDEAEGHEGPVDVSLLGDFILKEKDEIEVLEGKYEENFRARLAFVKESFTKHYEYIEATYHEDT